MPPLGWKKKINHADPKGCPAAKIQKPKSANVRKLKLFDDEANCPDDSEEADSHEAFESENEDSFIDDDSESDNDRSEGVEGEEDDPQTKSTSITTASAILQPKTKSRAVKRDCKTPGDITLPLNCFSLTISKVKDDVPYSLLKSIFDNFIVKFCQKGGISTEVGARVGNCHLQGVFQSHCCAAGPTFKLMSKSSAVNVM